MKIPKSLQESAPAVDPQGPEAGVEVHVSLYPLEGEPRRFAGIVASAPGLDELLEIEGDAGVYRVTEVRRSLRGMTELKPDLKGTLDGAYDRLYKRGVPLADELVFVTAEAETETDGEEGAEEEGAA